MTRQAGRNDRGDSATSSDHQSQGDGAARDAGYRVTLRNWEPRDAGWLAPGRRGPAPGPVIVFDPPIANRFRIGLEIMAEGIDVLRLRCRGRRPSGFRWRDVFVDVARPGVVLHELDRVVLGMKSEAGQFRLELEGSLEPGETLRGIALDASNDWFTEVDEAPGMALRILRVEMLPVDASAARPRQPHVAVRPDDEPAPDKRQHGARDAVVFAWWVPDTVEGRLVGEYYLGLLRRYHPDSRIFLGVNHGSHPDPVAAVLSSGLDVQVCPVPAGIDVNSDAGGFLAALAAFHQSPEPFALVWFGHTKGASRASDNYYRHTRFDLERRFWARRTEIERVFQDPAIGLFAARYNVPPTYPWPAPWRGWLDELAALRRIYRDRYPPLGLNALDTFFVLRGEIVRAFCDAVAPWFFHTDPGDYGASRWFFEMAFPSIATMQGYEPFIDMDVPGANNPRDDLMLEHDNKQTHRLAMNELHRWRDDPVGFQPRSLPWDRPAWQGPN